MDRSVRMAVCSSGVAAAALLSACSMNPYVPPAGGETARLRLVAAQEGPLIAMSVSEKSPEEITGACMAANWGRINDFGLYQKSSTGELVKRGKDYQYGNEKLGMPGSEGIADKQMTELPIAADRPFVGFFEGMRPNVPKVSYFKCGLYYAFRPDPGKDYEAVYRYEGDRCSAAVFRLEQTGTTVQRVPEPSAKFVPNTCK